LGGTTPAEQYDRLSVAGKLTLDGTLSVELIDGFEPLVGDRFDIISAGSLRGAFDDVALPALTGDLFWEMDSGGDRVTLSVQAVPEPGSLALLALGALGIAARARRRRGRSAGQLTAERS
jgi:hypothetical protein